MVLNRASYIDDIVTSINSSKDESDLTETLSKIETDDHFKIFITKFKEKEDDDASASIADGSFFFKFNQTNTNPGSPYEPYHIDDLVKAILLVAKDDRANGEIFIVTDGVPYSSREIYEVMRKILGKSIPKLYLPKFCFNLIAFFSLSFRYKVKKLFEDSYYSSRKINSIGFKPQRSLREMNETSF